MSQNFYILSSLAVVFILLLYLTDVGSSDIQPGFPCDGIPNFCDRISCVPPDKCTQGIIGKGGGNCGCCDVCITYQGKLLKR